MDIKAFRNPETLTKIRESQAKRFADPSLIEEVIRKDLQWKSLQNQINAMSRQRSILQNKIKTLFRSTSKDRKSFDDKDLALFQEKKLLDDKIARESINLNELLVQRDNDLYKIGNMVHDSVPVSMWEKDNIIVKEWGEIFRDIPIKESHHKLLYKIGGFDPVRGSKVSGNRGYFLRDVGVLLNQALINYGLSFLRKREYTMLQTPYIMKSDLMSKTSQLSDFKDQLYSIDGEKTPDKKKYLIATSEQPISAFHADEWIEGSRLPLRYAGYSTNFRKESGKSGKDVRGIFRVHQFEKIEQFCITSEDKSWDMHQSMLRISEEFYESLNLPYRVVNIVSGELNNAASKKYDLEGWFPSMGEYRELVSCSNCTDYQSRRLNIKTGDRKYVHMLNGTLCATSRTICCILENYQSSDGIHVPKVLIPYMDNMTFIPFVKDITEDIF